MYARGVTAALLSWLDLLANMLWATALLSIGPPDDPSRPSWHSFLVKRLARFPSAAGL